MKTASCEKCEGKDFSYSHYGRKPRGFPSEVTGEFLEEHFSSRISFLCRRCRKRTTPPSVRYLGRKVYVSPAILLACRLIEQGCLSMLEEIRKVLAELVPALTARRWIAWWRQAVWESSFWRERHGQLQGVIEQERLICGIWNHFDRVVALDLSDDRLEQVILHVLRFLSPLTRPQAYPS